jgi:hypothetical protein
LLLTIERTSAMAWARAYRQPGQSLRTRLTRYPYAVLYAAIVVWLCIALDSIATSRSAAILGIASACLVISSAWFWSAFVCWPFNVLGYVQATGAASLEGVPKQRDLIRQAVIAEWEQRLGREIFCECEPLWRLRRRATLTRVVLVVAVVVGVNAPTYSYLLWLLIAALLGVGVLWAIHLSIATKRERVQALICARLDVLSLTTFPPLDKCLYNAWLVDLQQI